MGKIILISGGARSGKSSFSLRKASESEFNDKKIFIATAVSLDTEMVDRIQRHRDERGVDWDTIEESVELEQVIKSLEAGTVCCLDCLTVWLGNIWFKYSANESQLIDSCQTLVSSMREWQKNVEGELIIVTNEVGWGIIPESSEVRLYRDVAGTLNQMVGSIANEVYIAVCGISMKIK